MTNPTSNYGWQMPTSTDLVTDLPADFEVFGQAVDTALAELKGGTTGQVLSKTSNTDMDFTWVAQDDSNAIQNAIVDAKGDLIGASAADTPSRLAVGTNGQVLTADSTAATGLAWATAGGGFTLIASGSLGSAGTNLTSIAATFKELRLVVRNFRCSTDGAFMGLRFNNDSSANRYKETTSNTDGLNTATAFDGTGMRASANNDNNVGTGLIAISIPDYANAETWKFMLSDSIMTNQTSTTSFSYSRLMGAYNQTTAISQLNIYPSAGTISAGTYYLYGAN